MSDVLIHCSLERAAFSRQRKAADLKSKSALPIKAVSRLKGRTRDEHFAHRYSTAAFRIYVSIQKLTDTAFKADAEQFLGLDGKLHGQLAKDFLAEAVDDHADGVFR